MRGKGHRDLRVRERPGITPACAGKRTRSWKARRVSQDHPCLCGEKYGNRCRIPRIPGSPPPVRGKGSPKQIAWAESRITPACAGKRFSRRVFCIAVQDHPRLCGEKQNLPADLLSACGSPPRVRGKAGRRRTPTWERGITPACAGKSFQVTPEIATGKDHPRVCGEKSPGGPMFVPSPWITPACAGKRGGLFCLKPLQKDHPRVCGEKSISTSTPTAAPGSPPRVRGKGGCTLRMIRRMRITPACAGKSVPPPCCATSCTDHPRVCGEKAEGLAVPLSSLGSPPRVRGKESSQKAVNSATGITPACAGKRSAGARHTSAKQDHPRVCGEKRVSVRDSFVVLGSPPRVRGKDVMYDYHAAPPRITPACAGKRTTEPEPAQRA